MIFNKKTQFLGLIILIGTCYSCACHKNWENATITYKNGFEMQGKVCSKEKSFFSFVRYINKNENKKEKLYPDEVKYIESKSNALISLHFDENIYGVDSYSFGKILAVDKNKKIKMVDTRYIVNDCNCAGRDQYLNGIFLIYNDKMLGIETNRSGKILNINNVYGFINNNINVELTSNVNNIETLSVFIKNINN